jgi:hypothetical protein
MSRMTEFEKGARAALFVLYTAYGKLDKDTPNAVMKVSDFTSSLHKMKNELVRNLSKQHKKGLWK